MSCRCLLRRWTYFYSLKKWTRQTACIYFREIIRIKNVLDCFTQFNFDDLPMSEQLFADFRSKYLDLYDKVRSEKQTEKVSILDDIDFEVELISRDKINVSYIITLLNNVKGKALLKKYEMAHDHG